MNRIVSLLRTPELAVERFDHPPHEGHEDPDVETGETFSLAFVLQGQFQIQPHRASRHARQQLRAGGILLLHPGLEFRCRHDERCPSDVCLSVRFADASVLGREDGWLHAPWITRPQATPRLAWTRHRLLQALQDHDAHAAEYWAGFAASALAHDTSGTRGRYTLASRELDAVIAVCDAVRADPAWRASIAERAHAVHCTAAQLTRAFRRALGMAPHQFVRRERLRHAASLLAAGESVSRTCYASGFDNLSHFVRSFRREFGLTPSQWRTNGPTALRRQIDGKVQAERVPLR